MRTQTQTILLLISLITLTAFNGVSPVSLGPRKTGLAGGWQPIKDIKDPHVAKIGQFAVSQHNKVSQTNLKFDQVVRGETQVVSGENYRLVIEADDGVAKNNYEAVVWEKAWQGFMDLSSFKQV
ncbi:hypothetical protein GIB67_013373 [Kingdonia uniflora]|uniref:Cystatin domain-containing protein n=1 Tax=Kingdonia uniflora TaxID=39325 RepID=A0A7J7LR54_9MAGN|nr:hypothetical protein GIB67_013373 [Kingdonia uniflora]